MRHIELATIFRRDYKREMKGQHGQNLDADLSAVLKALVADIALDPRLRDHALTGNWNGYRECHLRPDLLLIYKKIDDHLLRLARLGSHSLLFKK
jgi:mRNA interferase YafQ